MFNKNVFKNIEPNLFTQGFCYKNEKKWDDISLNDIVYIPEYAYITKDTTGIYTKQNIIDLITSYNFDKDFSETFLNMLDWQYPETLLNELEEDL